MFVQKLNQSTLDQDDWLYKNICFKLLCENEMVSVNYKLYKNTSSALICLLEGSLCLHKTFLLLTVISR